ncbi:hypothetical protein B0H63DRAFT_524647 [Podospora didyma]|uniref:Mid2 domain-containing protein n=1 Tax=Podospora didyma TaxID=330526 RepID=A0AAE0TWD2_9PEZI|nr:hypothetical protein B0H63DRAFT_524647 [Podospora didyma]
MSDVLGNLLSIDKTDEAEGNSTSAGLLSQNSGISAPANSNDTSNSNSASTSPSQAWIAGAVIGAVVGAALLAPLAFWLGKQRRAEGENPSPTDYSATERTSFYPPGGGYYPAAAGVQLYSVYSHSAGAGAQAPYKVPSPSTSPGFQPPAHYEIGPTNAHELHSSGPRSGH